MRTVIRAARLFDGSGDAPQAAEIVIEGDQIVDVVRGQGTVDMSGDQVIDLPEGTLLPGLIDAHVHIIGSGDPGDSAFGVGDILDSIPDVTLHCLRNATRDLMAGFTTIRDAAARHYADIAVRDAINRGEFVGPRIWACGLGITSTTGHMDREKILPPHLSLPGPSTVADSPDEARKAVRLNLRYNVDFIKFNATLTEHVRRYRGYCAPEMTFDTMKALIEESHWHGRTVTAHCYGGDGANWALEAGIDGIEHGFYLTDENLQHMAEHGTVLCPTLSVVGRFREMGTKALPAGSPSYLDAWRQKAIANAWKTTARARELGVKIICGTDAAMPYVTHGGNAYELEMLVEAGLTPTEALVAATSGAADGIAFPEVGRVEVGKFADLVWVDGDPLSDVRVLQQIERVGLVIKGGEIVADRRSNVGAAVVA